MKSLLPFVSKDKIGVRTTGFNGYRVLGYYFNKKGLNQELLSAGFTNIEIYSLEEFYKKTVPIITVKRDITI